jgi:hypothetical protein
MPGRNRFDTDDEEVVFDALTSRSRGRARAWQHGIPIGVDAMIYVRATWPQKIRDQLQTQYHRVKPFVSAALLWERVLTADERERLGNDLAASYRELGTVGMWKNIRGGSDLRALIEIAFALNLLNETDHDWLVREIGEELDQPKLRSGRPTWDRCQGRLFFGGNVIRSIRTMKGPSNIHVILEAFEKRAWPIQIDNPLRNGQQQLHQALRSLNTKLSGIRFHASGGGTIISWKIA